MASDLKTILLGKMKERGIKIPKLAQVTGIPKDRIYKWFSEGSNPKAEDAAVLHKWISNGEIDKHPRETFTISPQQAALNSMFIRQIALLRSKVLGVTIDDAIDELEKIAQIELNQSGKGGI